METEQPAVNPMNAEVKGHIERYMESGDRSQFTQAHWDHLDSISPCISQAAADLHDAFESDIAKVPPKQRAEALLMIDKRDDLRAMSFATRYLAIKEEIGKLNEANKGDKSKQYHWSPKTVMAVNSAFDKVKQGAK